MEDEQRLSQSEGLKGLTTLHQVRDILTVVAILGTVGWVVTPSSPPHEDKRVPLGKVEGVHFFGYALTLMTQLDTRAPAPDAGASDPIGDNEYRSLVLAGMSQFRKGQEVVLNIHRFGAEVCNLDNTYCQEVKGNPQ